MDFSLRPLETRDAAALATYLALFRDAGEDRIPAYFPPPGTPIDDVVLTLAAWSRGERLQDGYVPHTTLFAVRRSDGALLAHCNIRHSLTPHLRECGGHVGYSVAPPHRGSGVATAMLKAAMPLVRKLSGDDVALVTASADNPASQRVVEKCGGGVVREAWCERVKGTLRYMSLPLPPPGPADKWSLFADAYQRHGEAFTGPLAAVTARVAAAVLEASGRLAAAAATAARGAGLRVLDLACGTGVAAEAVRRLLPHAELFVTDFAPGMVDVTRRRLQLDDRHAFVADAAAVPAEHHGQYDLVVSNVGLFLVPPAAIAQVRLLLKPGGVVVSSFWDMSRSFNSKLIQRMVALARRWPGGGGGDAKGAAFADKMAAAAAHGDNMRASGLADVRQYAATVPVVLPSAKPMVDGGLDNPFLCDQFAHLSGDALAAFKAAAVAAVEDMAGGPAPFVLHNHAFVVCARREGVAGADAGSGGGAGAGAEALPCN